MRNVANRIGWPVALVGALALGACGGDDPNPAQDPLLGTWTYSGSVPDEVTVALTFNPDKTFTFVEQLAPSTEPAGFMPDGCVTTDTFSAKYAEAVSGGTNTLTWTFAGGTTNAVSGCKSKSNDLAGTPMTTADIKAYTVEGLVPPTTLKYTATSTSLILTSSVTDSAGVGQGSGTTFTKSD
jgi:hypothetical protein